MTLLSMRKICFALGTQTLLDHIDFSLSKTEKVGLIGRNGSGKSTLLKIITGLQHADDGKVETLEHVHIAYVAQEPLFDSQSNVLMQVAQGLKPLIELRNNYEALVKKSVLTPIEQKQLSQWQQQLDLRQAWHWEQRVHALLDAWGLDPHALISHLSGGQKKLVALAQAFITRCDVLLLDEPTNHLDISRITWLEQMLKQWQGAILVVSHDRAFLDAITHRTIELDRGFLSSWQGNFSYYEKEKALALEQERVLLTKQDKLLAQEEVWIRRGIEARRTRSQSRINRLHELRKQRSERREAVQQVEFGIDSGVSSGKLVVELKGICHSFGERKLIQHFTATLLRGDKVGILGDNGVGKSTILKIILGEIAPQQGKVRLGSQLQLAYFDQERSQLNDTLTVAETISPGSEWVEINNKRKHVISYAADFLFSSERCQTLVASLSGGERNRLLLARLFATPANLLVLDEPTNDLDIETIDLLEELIQSYQGTVIIVSHDRRFIDQTVTSVIAHEGGGAWRQYVGGYADWQTQSKRSLSHTQNTTTQPLSANPVVRPQTSSQEVLSKTKKLSYKEQREYDALPSLLEAQEHELAQLQSQLADPATYQNPKHDYAAMAQKIQQLELSITQILERWHELAERA